MTAQGYSCLSSTNSTEQMGEGWSDFYAFALLNWKGRDKVFAIFLIVAASLKGFDTNLERAARNLGANAFQTFRHVLLPMAVPILMVVFLLAFIGTIIEYPVASVLLREEENLTLAVGSKYYLYEQKYLWGDFAAAAVLSGLPITLVFLAAQRWIVSGLTSGGVKG